LVRVGDAAGLAAAMDLHIRRKFPIQFLMHRASEFSSEVCVRKHLALFETFDRPARKPFDLPFAHETAQDVADRVLCTSPGASLSLVVTPNIDHIRLLRNVEFAAAYADATIVCADGYPVALYAWALGHAKLHRVTGCDVLHKIFSSKELCRHRIFIITETEETSHALSRWTRHHAPNLNVCAVAAPLHLLSKPTVEEDLAQRVLDFGTTILVVTLGAPVSEVFVHRQRSLLPASWVLCVGQAVRVEIDIARRAPLVLRLLGLEWLWRLLNEPRRLFGRYVASAAWFPCAVTIDLWKRGNGRKMSG
jgi:N-acetylglucosaminyldiphosphoundecaprenol N-acetyl-beta-D-mannosaminyltransferase